jgi:hypothetical protein
MPRFRSGLLGVIVGLICAGTAAAQPATTLGGLETLENGNERVTVTDTAGRQFSGTLADVSETQLALKTSGETRQFSAQDIRSVRVRKGDSLRNGTLTGAAIGGGVTSLIFLDNECHDDPFCYTVVGVWTGIGALIGMGVDALIHRNVVVYTAPPSGARREFIVVPFGGRNAAGLRLGVAF